MFLMSNQCIQFVGVDLDSVTVFQILQSLFEDKLVQATWWQLWFFAAKVTLDNGCDESSDKSIEEIDIVAHQFFLLRSNGQRPANQSHLLKFVQRCKHLTCQ